MDTKEKERKHTGQRRPASPSSGARKPAGKPAASGKAPAGKRTGTPAKKSAAPATGAKGRTAVKEAAPSRRQSQTNRRPSASSDRKSSASASARTQTQRRRRTQKPAETKRIIPEVVYLPPKPFSRNRLVLRLATVAAVVLAVILGVSVFFKVDTVIVYGNEKYSAYDIQTAAGIEAGDYLLTFSRARAAGKIRETLPYVENVRFGIKLPGTVNIVITEVEVTYSIEDSTGNWWLVNSAGRVLEQIPIGGQVDHTRIEGVKLEAPQVNQLAVALEDGEVTVDPEGNTIGPVVTAQQRLETALDIADYLELNSMIAKVAVVNVSALEDIQLTYGRKYQVLLGDGTQLSYKISVLRGAVAELEQTRPHWEGKLDITNPPTVVVEDIGE